MKETQSAHHSEHPSKAQVLPGGDGDEVRVDSVVEVFTPHLPMCMLLAKSSNSWSNRKARLVSQETRGH